MRAHLPNCLSSGRPPSGGFCDDLHDPSSGPTGYWCSQKPPRGQCYDPDKRTSRGCTQTHMSPDGLRYTEAMLPHAKSYTNIQGAVVQAWRCVRWFTNLCLVDSMNKETGEIIFDKTAGGGCNQGGEGCVRFAREPCTHAPSARMPTPYARYARARLCQAPTACPDTPATIGPPLTVPT
jgi:hypothetical protein